MENNKNKNKPGWPDLEKGKFKEKGWRNQHEKLSDSPQAVLFVPYTNGSGLAKQIREIIQNLKPYTGINHKIVERAGKKIIDSLHRSNPWENTTFERENCLPCESSKREIDQQVKSCKRRSVIYKTWCQTCREELTIELKRKYLTGEKTEVENNKNKRKRNNQEKENKENIEKILKKEIEEKTYRYIGETSRSVQERGEEHLRYLRDRDPGSHFLKHIVQHHMNTPERMEFRMKIVSTHFTALYRQISEAVLINRNKGPYLLNSKSQYSRCTLPCVKTGNKRSSWEVSDIDENEMKESIRILKHNGTKFNNKMKIEGEEDSGEQ